MSLDERMSRAIRAGTGYGPGVAYIRVADGESVAAEIQAEQIDAWAREYHSQIVDWFWDLGVDGQGRLVDRPGGIRLLDRVLRGDVHFVITTRLDRLSENGPHLLEAMQFLTQRDVPIFVLDGGVPPALTEVVGQFDAAPLDGLDLTVPLDEPEEGPTLN